MSMAIGTGVVVAVLMCAGTAPGTPILPLGTYWFPTKILSAAGCAQVHAYPPKFAFVSGRGSEKVGLTAKSCPAYRGGAAVGSFAELSEDQIDVVVPVVLAPSNHGVNVTWNLTSSEALSGALNGSSACPTTRTVVSRFYNASPYYSYWFNSTTIYGNCEAAASLELSGGALLNGYNRSGALVQSIGASTWFDNFTWAGFENFTDWYHETIDYTSGPYKNTSYTCACNVSLAQSGGTFAWSWQPVYYLNATSPFNALYNYSVDTWIDVQGMALALGFSGGGHASATLSMAGAQGKLALRPMVVW